MKFNVNRFEELTPVCRGKVSYYAEIGSTNSVAHAAVLAGEADSGSIYIAESQTKGRGRGAHQWTCPAGEGLLFSLVLDPDAGPQFYYRMSLAVGMAIVAVTREMGLETEMKWPNDIYLGDKKLGGILIETADEMLVVGVGLNVNIQLFPVELVDKATSLSIATGEQVNREKLLSRLVQSICQDGSLIGQSFPKLLERVQDCLYMKNEVVRMTVPEGELIGTVLGLSENGYLLMKEMTEAGAVREVEYASEIRKIES